MASDAESGRHITLEQTGDHWIGRFRAMASPCEVLSESADRDSAHELTALCANEAWRIEDKYSRYRRFNVVHAINTSSGAPVRVDEETVRLLDFAFQLHAMSDGRFDVSSGVLREVWRFDGSDRLPTREQVNAVLPRVGLDKVDWQPPHIGLQAGMEIDFGGIAKEYAVDHAAAVCADISDTSCLINFGGDLAVSRERNGRQPWLVGIEGAPKAIALYRGAIATSGDAHRFLQRDGVRYSHILDPTTGWPVEQAPQSITVLADSCTQAGMLATLAMLRGAGAEAFLDSERVKYWCCRDTALA